MIPRRLDDYAPAGTEGTFLDIPGRPGRGRATVAGDAGIVRPDLRPGRRSALRPPLPPPDGFGSVDAESALRRGELVLRALRLPRHRVRAHRILSHSPNDGSSQGLTAAAVVFGVVARLVHLDDTPSRGRAVDDLHRRTAAASPTCFSLVKSDAEISPPLYFVLAWICAQLGSVVDLFRLPALARGTRLDSARVSACPAALRDSAGLVAAALMALNPFMVFYSTEARAYSLGIALLLASTLAMLDRGRAWFLRLVGGFMRRWLRWRCTPTTPRRSCSGRRWSGCSGRGRARAGRHSSRPRRRRWPTCPGSPA